MADIKLGSKTFTGIKIVSMNTPDGGKQTFSSGGGGFTTIPVNITIDIPLCVMDSFETIGISTLEVGE